MERYAGDDYYDVLGVDGIGNSKSSVSAQKQ